MKCHGRIRRKKYIYHTFISIVPFPLSRSSFDGFFTLIKPWSSTENVSFPAGSIRYPTSAFTPYNTIIYIFIDEWIWRSYILWQINSKCPIRILFFSIYFKLYCLLFKKNNVWNITILRLGHYSILHLLDKTTSGWST